MMDIMFDLPDQGAGQFYEVTEDVIMGNQKLFPIPKNKSA